MEQLVQLISTVGFPIVACWYLATTMNKTLADLTGAIKDVISVVGKLHDKIDNMEV